VRLHGKADADADADASGSLDPHCSAVYLPNG
jgi:hypothetical protein